MRFTAQCSMLFVLVSLSLNTQAQNPARPNNGPCPLQEEPCGPPLSFAGLRLPGEDKTRVHDLASNLIAVKRGGVITEGLKNAIRDDLIGLADESMKSEGELIGELVNDLLQALSRARRNNQARTEMAYSLLVVLNVPRYQSATGPARSSINMMLDRMGIRAAERQRVADALNAVVGRGIEKMDAKSKTN
jgi:hypothetical protein